MKLLSTLRYPVAGMPPGTGNYGGELRLFFTTLNPADWVPTPAPIVWKGGGKGATDTYKLPSGDEVALNLDICSELPGQLYVYGTIEITTASGGFNIPPIGQASPTLFAPGHPSLAILEGRMQGSQRGAHFDVGFELAVPWDGTSADCHGTWWAVWY
jgi:hypothetical protein